MEGERRQSSVRELSEVLAEQADGRACATEPDWVLLSM